MITRKALSSDSVRHLSNSEEFVDNGNEGTFEETSMPVVDYYRARNKVVEVSLRQTRFDGNPG